MSDKSICIVSSYAYIRNNNNYGALLQYYALQKYFEKHGIKAFWLRYIEPKTNILFYLKHLVGREYKSSLFIKELVCHFSFMKFCKRYLNFSPVYSQTKLEKDSPVADFYMTGSDQVWGGTIKANFLRFVKDNNKKIAFAVSFGREELTEQQIAAGVEDWIKDFKAVSVREKSGLEICRKLNVDAVYLLDPTFLLDKTDYLQLKKTDKPVKKNYIQCYFLNVKNKADVSFDKIEEFANLNNLKLKVTGVGNCGMNFPSEYYFYPSPEDWLSSYNNADYIVTNTFHGTVFAIIFQKKFVTLLQSGTTAQQNTRIHSLLGRFNLLSRICTEADDLEEKLKSEIDWSAVEHETEINRKSVADFLCYAGILGARKK